MTIKYFRNEHKELTRIEFVADGIVKEMISDGFSYIYMKRIATSLDEKRYIRQITSPGYWTGSLAVKQYLRLNS